MIKLIKLIKLYAVFFVGILISILTANITHAQHFAAATALSVDLTTRNNLLTTPKNSPAQGEQNNPSMVTMTVFYDYNCKHSRDLLKVLISYIHDNNTTNNNTKIIYRPMDYGSGSKSVLQNILYAKNQDLNFTSFMRINRLAQNISSGNVSLTNLNITAPANIDLNNDASIATEMANNRVDFDALPFPSAGLDPQYKSAIPVVVLTNSAGTKVNYFIGADKGQLDAAIANTKS